MRQESGFDLAKALSFILAFVAFSMIIGVGFLVPTVRSINKQATMMAIEAKSYKAVKDKFDEEDTKLNNLKKENEASLKALGTSFNSDKFLNDTKARYQTILQQTDSATEGDYSIEEYNVGMNFQDPKAMFDFLDSLGKTGSLIKIQTPIVIETTSGKTISTNYYVRAVTAKLADKKEVNSTTEK